MELATYIFLLLLGISILVWGANKFVDHASFIAKHLGISDLVIGLTLIAFGTSAPEIFVAISGVLNSNEEIALGTAIGSNISNIALIFGVSCLYLTKPSKTELWHLMPFGLSILLLGLTLVDGKISFNESLGFVGILMLFMFVLLKTDSLAEEESSVDGSFTVSLFLSFVGLVALVAGAHITVINAEASGDTAFMVTKVVLDPHAGEIAVGRLFSGTIKKGDQLYVAGMPSANRVQSVGMFVGGDRINTENVTAGNIIAVSGLRDAISGSTVSSDKEMTPFERIIHNSEPVVTTAIEAKHTKDLPKLVEVLRAVAKADPSIQIDSNLETGEHLMSGMGELHLEITEYRIRNEHGVEITTSPPIVVYRETVAMNSPGDFEGKSPNKHNRFYITVEPLEEDIRTAIIDGTIPSGDIKKSKEVARQLIDMGWTKVHGKGVLSIENSCVFIDATKGIQNLFETRELLIDAFKEVVKRGPRAHERMMGVKIILNDAKLHEDAIHRGPAQTIPAVRNGINGALVSAGVALLEPKQHVYINVPQELMGSVTGEMSQRRAEIAGMETEGDMTTITAKAPIKEMFGFASEIRSATGGRALWSTEFSGYEALPHGLLDEITEEIRLRKGLKAEMPRPENYS